MFRIKTDIRQYKCETKDKVEKLIRNWVIRPTDLIYNTSDKNWSPIGDHPAFTGIFDVLDQQEKNTPDTVVTARNPFVEGSGEVSESEVEEEPAQEEEVTQLVDRRELEGGDDEARKTDVFDEDEVSASLAGQSPRPPEAPEGVEPVTSDEVTMMTERTLDMLKVDDDDEKGDDEEEVSEVTDVRKRRGARGVVVDETLELGAEEESDGEDEAAPEGAEEEVKAPKSGPKLGRHDLPEELFATNEISSPEVREQMKMLDELADLKSDPSEASEVSEPTIARESDKPNGSSGKGWNVSLEGDSAVDEAWQEVAQDVATEASESEDDSAAPAAALRETDELAREDVAEPEETTNVIERPALADSEAEEESEPEDDADDESDAESDSDPDLDAESEEDPEDDLPEVVTDFEPIDDDFSEDTSEPEEIPAPTDFVSDGYKIPLPFPIRPTEADIRKGLRLGKASTSRRDATFPLPEPKKLDEVHHRRFDLTPVPPRDRTAVIVGALIVILVVAAIAVAC